MEIFDPVNPFFVIDCVMHGKLLSIDSSLSW